MRSPAMAALRCLEVGALLAWMALQSGCATLGVKPWERDQLAWPKMQMNANPTEAAIDDHIYFSKEASSGGRGFGGGGCGCN
ncbi:MAG: DUF4266 domain-containing protein [bacterium]